MPPEEVKHSVHTHGTAARHGGGNISLSLALLPAKPGWDLSPAPREQGWAHLEGFDDHCGYQVCSSHLFRCNNSQKDSVMREGWGKGTSVNKGVFGGRNPICPAQEFGMLRLLRQRGFTCVKCRFPLCSWIFPVCKHHNHRKEIPARAPGWP